RFVIRLRHVVLAYELRVTLRIGSRAPRLRLIAGEHRLGLLERRLERARVDLEQELPGRDVVALPERDAREDPRHLRLDRRRLARLDRAGREPLLGDGGLLGAGDGRRAAGGGAAAPV